MLSRRRNITLIILALFSLVFAVQVLIFQNAARLLFNDKSLAGCACGITSLTSQLDFYEGMILGISGLFAIGIFVGGVYFLATLIRTRRLTRKLSKCARLTGPAGQAYLLAEDHCEAFTFGFFNPRVAICAHCVKTLPAREIQAMLCHEAHHVLRRDPLKFFALDILKQVYFFAPIFRHLARLYRTVAEIEADEQVADREALGKALLKVAVWRQRVGGVASFASVVGERIERLLNPQWHLRMQISRRVVFAYGTLLFAMLALHIYAPKTQSVAMVCIQPATAVCEQIPVYGVAWPAFNF